MLSPLFSPKYHHLNKLPSQPTALAFARYPVFGLSILCSLGIATISLLSINIGSVVAQVPTVSSQMPTGETPPSQLNVLFVNPNAGDDTRGNGSENAPWRTITQALQVATPNTIIKLAPGTYSADTGEVFPLMLKPGVFIQGDTENKGQGISIQGGGLFLSRSFGGQNVTIVGANKAGVSGVTVTNSNPRGYGVWIESSQTIIADNTFTGNTQDGVAVAGNSASTITKNYFYRNGANGITISGNSPAQVRENVFAQTGFGINITQNAVPVIISNVIQDNRAGIIVQAKARPILRQNIIQGSKEDGLVAIAQAMPDLGNASEPGGNQFRNNGRYDINASAAQQEIIAVGNTINRQRLAGKVNVTASVATPNHQILQPTPDNREIDFTAPSLPDTNNQPSQPIIRNQNRSQASPLTSADAPLTIPRYNQTPSAAIANTRANRNRQITTRPVSPRKPTTLPPVPPQTAQLNFLQIDNNSIEFVAPQEAQPQPTVTNQQQSWPSNLSPLPPGLRQQSNPRLPVSPVATNDVVEVSPVRNNQVLLVPSGNIPLGNTRNMRKVTAPTTYTTRDSSNYISSSNAGLRYRVVVETITQTEQELVKYLAPGAFSTVWQGRRVMQAGVFSSRDNADAMVGILNSNGLRSIVEPLN